jgi:hypothetical protein
MSSLPDPSPWKPPFGALNPGFDGGADGSAAGPGGGAAPDAMVLAREVRRLADRYRHLSESRLRGRTDPDDPSGTSPTRAAAGLALARRLAALGDAPAGAEVPDLGVFAVGDQIAVTGLDLVAHLAAGGDAKASPGLGGEDGQGGPAAEAAAVLDEALHAVREVAAQV